MHANTILLASAVIMALFTLPAAHAEDPAAPLPPDLCEEPVLAVTGEVYMDQQGSTISRFCKPRIDPPVLDREVCCSIGTSASCKLPNSVGRCTSGMKFWCEFGEMVGSGVACYQDGPGMCEQGFCNAEYVGGGTPFEDSSWVCCSNEGECVYVGESGMTPPAGASCAGSFTMCSHGSTNEDGTVNCEFDG